MKYNDKVYLPFKSAFNEPERPHPIVERRSASPFPRGRSKVTRLDSVMDLIRDGDTISYPHYYRTGDLGLKQIVSALRAHGKREIILYANAIFDHTDPWLMDAYRDGVLSGLYGNVYRRFGAHITAGDLLPWRTVGFSHGNRVRKLQTGEVHIRVAFGPVPLSDVYGNANGVSGKPEQCCGPVGLFSADAEFADYTCLLAGTVSNPLIVPAAISMEQVDFVVPMDPPGLSEGIGSGTLDLDKIRSRPFNARIAEQVTRVMEAAEVVQEGVNFQVGSGAGLIVLDKIRTMLKNRRITAGFAIGGVTSMHVDMLEEGTLRTLLHGQLFEPSHRVVESLRTDPRHIEISAGYYASMANKEAAVNLLDVAVLSALEVDLGFNLNTVCANGRIIGGIGGGQDVAAGAGLTIIFLPLATGKDGKGFPKVVERVFTRTTPGEVVDVVVTEEFVAVNPNSPSPAAAAIRENAAAQGLSLVTIEELHARSVENAMEFGTIPSRVETGDEVVHLIEWRDGTLLDTIRRTL